MKAKRLYSQHGLTNSPEYWVWNAMKNRCTNPKTKNFHRYGGRGITIAERWFDFANFIADMGRRPSVDHQIDRVDNNGPYSPENCVWKTRKEQCRNTATNSKLTYKGTTLTKVEWAERLGITESALWLRLKNKWPADQLFSPGRQGNNQYTGSVTGN